MKNKLINFKNYINTSINDIIYPIKANIEELKKNPYYLVISNPKLYFSKIGLSTLYVGIITLIINIIYVYTPLHTVKVPTSIHSLVGFVIALLLVFRTNTAYDRWWEGRKKISDINASISIFLVMLNNNKNNLSKDSYNSLINGVNDIIVMIKDYLKSSDKEDFLKFHLCIMNEISIYLDEIENSKISSENKKSLKELVKEIMVAIVACERIKTTPIPFSYYIHIKVCIFLYLITLPFSILYELNLWGTLVVMILYFLISGIEIISNEIENPFSGEPNDLPIDSLFGNIENTIKSFK